MALTSCARQAIKCCVVLSLIISVYYCGGNRHGKHGSMGGELFKAITYGHATCYENSLHSQDGFVMCIGDVGNYRKITVS